MEFREVYFSLRIFLMGRYECTIELVFHIFIVFILWFYASPHYVNLHNITAEKYSHTGMDVLQMFSYVLSGFSPLLPQSSLCYPV